MQVNLSELVCETFEEIFEQIVNCEVDRVIKKGGRSSTKSQVTSEEILIGCMVYKESAVCLVKRANKIEERLVNTFKSSIRYLGIEKWWKLRKSPFEYVLLDKNGKETDISIKFTGCDDPDNLKSYRSRSGTGFRYIWFEEVTNFKSLEEIDNIIDTMCRGVNRSCTILTYNPPMSNSSWVNKEFNKPCGRCLGYDSDIYINPDPVFIKRNGKDIEIKQIIHHSSYLDVLASGHDDWLGTTFLGKAETARLNNPTYYRWNYLGEVIGTGANIFNNICEWKDTGKVHFKSINRGLDCSNGGPDPWMYTEWYYDKVNRDLYCLNECRVAGNRSIEDVRDNIRKINNRNYQFYIDGAVPTFSRQLRTLGLNPILAKKGQDSVIAGIMWLISMNHIYIDPVKCPVTYNEFKGYEWLLDKYDELTNKPVDKNNHSIDSCRYAMSFEIKYE